MAYQWTDRDKGIYAFSLVFFLAAFLGGAILMWQKNPWITVVFLGLYAMTVFFQAGCCIGCPYRGSYCPALFGIYPANLLSTVIYKNRTFDQAFFDRNASMGEIMVIVIIAYGAFWLFTMHWLYALLFLLAALVHVVIFLRLICPKCSYNETCPGGQLACRLMRSSTGT